MKLHFCIPLLFLLLLCTFFLNQCKKKQTLNYIEYYQAVNKTDSLYRITNQSKNVIAGYGKLFQKFPPKNQQYINELETYIKLSDQHQMDFGGKKTLYHLIELNAPSIDKSLYPFFKKYGIDSIKVEKKISEWKKNLNKTLIDSLTIASKRDQETKRTDTIIMRRNDNKNLNLFLWIFDHYGFPTEQKIGTAGNDGEPLIIVTILSHLICLDYNKIHPELYKFLKNGDISPKMYALTIDKYYLCKKNESYYDIYGELASREDSLIVNRRRKNIGLPSLTHYSKIRKDFFKKK